MSFTERLEMIHEDLDRLHNEMADSRKADKTKKQYQNDLRYFAAQLDHFAEALYSVIEDPEELEYSKDEKIKALVSFIKEKLPYDKRADFAWRTGVSEVIE
jgi:hypothetical protein